MRDFFLALGLLLIAISALFHIYVFYLESIAWNKPRTRKAFGIENEEIAKVISPMAFNQGFYNLFLAIEIIIGLILIPTHSTIAYTCIYIGSGSVVGAGLVLLLSSKKSKRAALLQLLPALLALTLITIGSQIH